MVPYTKSEAGLVASAVATIGFGCKIELVKTNGEIIDISGRTIGRKAVDMGNAVAAGAKIPRIISGIRKGNAWIMEGFGMAALVVLGILALINPFGAVDAVFKFIAAGLFIDAVFSLTAWFMAAKQG